MIGRAYRRLSAPASRTFSRVRPLHSASVHVPLLGIPRNPGHVTTVCFSRALISHTHADIRYRTKESGFLATESNSRTLVSRSLLLFSLFHITKVYFLSFSLSPPLFSLSRFLSLLSLLTHSLSLWKTVGFCVHDSLLLCVVCLM